MNAPAATAAMLARYGETVLLRRPTGQARRGDQIIIAGRTTTVQGVETVSVRDEIVRYNMQVRGG